ncbi:MAG: energy-coupling factor ABC transporter permease, partial [Acidobacteria bacterium]|nr:energy-coupling factor ABC transporter permease [Acidobacteriota bacterium]
MTAILAIQSLVFQDGGVLALGANVVNMALVGVLAAWLPYRARAGGRKVAIFTGAFLSVSCAGSLALAQLLVSGIRIQASVLWISLALFVVAALMEGGITLAVMGAIEKIQPGWIHPPARQGKRGAVFALATAALMLVVGGVLLASSAPDGLERLIQDAGLASRSRNLLPAPLADYQWNAAPSEWLRKAAAGLAGLALIYGVCVVVGRSLTRRRNR